MLYRASATGEESVRKGSVLTGSENNFAIKLPDQQIISDGINLWQYNPAQKQVLVKLIADLENNLHPTELIFRYLGTKAVSAKTELWKGVTVNAITLNPDKYREQFSAMEVWISPRDCSPLRLHTIDNLGNEVWYSIENLTAVKLSRDDFKFKLPLGVEEIDLR
ncbi:hypothetical protein AGMMS49938_04260 [Fibrobacterales bacterium]|nr:hypothetical protein AGMMS49938_04260 [Fibrobacterales bacterium]